MAEFTGERLIPGEVDIDLLNEHMARYNFAARFTRGKRVLDAGCGAGYGSAELARMAERVTGIDIAPEAVAFARSHYKSPNLSFEQASCTELPFKNAAFDLVVAFEVIEHLQDWKGFLQEVRRVLAPAGQLIVSTPNRLYYTASRGVHGANPFHVHEFDFDEFKLELTEVFPCVSMFLENHVEGVAFQPHEPGHTVEARVEATDPLPDESHFFVAVCADRRQIANSQIDNPTFIYVPRTANVLRERERHIAKLEAELITKDAWLDKAHQDLTEFDREHQKLLSMFRDQKEDLERSNRWAGERDAELSASRARVDALQQELERDQQNARIVAAQYNAKIAELEQEGREMAQWALGAETRLTAEIQTVSGELVRLLAAHEETEKELQDRTAWARRLDEEKRQLENALAMVRASRWIMLGRKVGLGPAL